jgi:hypothetical protein
MPDDVITKAELARVLHVSTARVAQLCKQGLPVRSDGKVDRTKAVEWFQANVDSWHARWWDRGAWDFPIS